MANQYPNPCDSCNRKERCSVPCDKFRIWFLWYWKQFHTYPTRSQKRAGKRNVFCYEHPDMIRKYLQDGPCGECKIAGKCETPCVAYWNWWDARMEFNRRRMQHENI